MRIAIGSGPVAARKHTAPVPHLESVADIGGDEALFAADVQYAGGAAQDHWQDAGVAGVLPQLTGSQLGAVSQTGTSAITQQVVVVDQHHQVGTIPTMLGCFPVDSDPAGQLHQRIRAALWPRRLRHTRVA